MAESSYPDALPAQYRLHWYVLERVLGQGGFGIPYPARDTNLDQPVAIKEYLPVDVATRRADATVRARSDEQNERYRWGLERFIREARTLARFDHPNIVRVLSVFEHNNTAYMVMRFEEGENFAALLERRRTLPEAELMRVLLPVIDGLALVHDANFIHRDIKPDNIHVRDDGSPVLLDFGSARLALGQARTVTILIAPGYAPFEQYYSSGENQGPWTDIYGLGATCYRAISGIAPMDAIARSKGILGSTREILVPASAIGKGRYSDRLLAAIDHALEFSEKDRPQSLADWRRELTAPDAAGSAAGAPTVRSDAAPAPAAAVSPSARGPIIGAVIGAIVAVVAVVIYLQPGAERDKLAQALQQSQEERQRLQAQQEELVRRETEATKLLEARERQQREEQARREAEAKSAPSAEPPAQPKKPSPVVAREAKPKSEPPRARVQSPPAPSKPATPERAAASEPTAIPPPLPVPTAASPGTQKVESETLPAQAEASARKAENLPSEAAKTKPAEAVSTAKVAPDGRTRALQGDASAQYRLGENYETGRGVTQNYFQAYYWYSAAARGGNAAAKSKKDQMAARLQPAEIQQAEKLVERLARSPK